MGADRDPSKSDVAPAAPPVLNSRPDMAAKKPTPNKSAFIRSQPAAMSTADVIAKGKVHGMKISSSLVYMVRTAKRTVANVAKKTVTVPKTAAPSNAATMNKADFVRSRSHLSPKEIVEDAKAAGLKLDGGYVYNVRGAAKAKSKTKVTKLAARRVRKAPAVARPTTIPSKAEDLLKAVAAEIGLGRAMEILLGERARARAVIGG